VSEHAVLLPGGPAVETLDARTGKDRARAGKRAGAPDATL
jgi:hypothetical protein